MNEVKETGEVRETSKEDDLVKRYRVKWGVSEEEAKEKVKKFMEKRPVDRSRAMPSTDNLFPDPVGPLSEKVQDINQAVLSTAFTKKSLKEMNQPPEEMERLKSEVGTVKETVNNVMELVTKRLEELQGTLDEKVRKEDRDALIAELDAKILQPLRSDLEAVKKRVETAPEPAKTAEGLREVRARLKQAEEDAKGVLEDMGYPLPKKRILELGPEEYAVLPKKDEDIVAELKKRGYRVEYDMIPREEALKLAEEAKRRAQEDLIDDQRIKSVENIVTKAIDNLFDMFKEPLQRAMETAWAAREEQGLGGAKKSEKEPSASQGS